MVTFRNADESFKDFIARENPKIVGFSINDRNDSEQFWREGNGSGELWGSFNPDKMVLKIHMHVDDAIAFYEKMSSFKGWNDPNAPFYAPHPIDWRKIHTFEEVVEQAVYQYVEKFYYYFLESESIDGWALYVSTEDGAVETLEETDILKGFYVSKFTPENMTPPTKGGDNTPLTLEEYVELCKNDVQERLQGDCERAYKEYENYLRNGPESIFVDHFDCTKQIREL